MFQHWRVSTLLVFLSACALSSYCQSDATFHVQAQQFTSTYQITAAIDYAVDLNNDGVQDLVEVQNTSPSEFSVYLANGDGTFRSGFTYTFPAIYPNNTAMATGDFNGDGVADLVFLISDSNELVMFLGNGDGTFQTPKFETIAVPSGQKFGFSRIAAADFNHDGNLDLVAASASGTGFAAMNVIPGNSDGTFGPAMTVYAGAENHIVGSGPVLTGDFDADGTADIAFLDISNCMDSGLCDTVLHVLYGNGGFNFTDSVAYTSSYSFVFGAGDVNSDGPSDLFAVVGLNNLSLVVLYGQTDRTFALHTQSAGGSSTYFVDQGQGFELGDFNGDGRMDIVGLSSDTSGTEYFNIYLGTSSLGAFTQQKVALPRYLGWRMPLVGEFNRDEKPDIVTVAEDTKIMSPEPLYIVDARNTTSSGFWGPCAYPTKGQGIGTCFSTTAAQGSPVHFNAAANSYGSLRKIELWVDGKKVAEQWHAWEQRAWFNKSISFAAGSHYGSFVAGDVDNHLQRLQFTFNVVNCSAPSSPGVHVCSPANGSTMSSPVQATAAASVNGTIQRMELWVDGVKKSTVYNTNALSISVTLPSGKHNFGFFAFNTAGTKWESTVYFTVK